MIKSTIIPTPPRLSGQNPKYKRGRQKITLNEKTGAKIKILSRFEVIP